MERANFQRPTIEDQDEVPAKGAKKSKAQMETKKKGMETSSGTKGKETSTAGGQAKDLPPQDSAGRESEEEPMRALERNHRKDEKVLKRMHRTNEEDIPQWGKEKE